ncbi:MAG: hypothetical protein H6739_22990 [Alphaproteobacteria bacterium]|nr:hypothetical protein [Alphaproteobacteria bacterium]
MSSAIARNEVFRFTHIRPIERGDGAGGSRALIRYGGDDALPPFAIRALEQSGGRRGLDRMQREADSALGSDRSALNDPAFKTLCAVFDRLLRRPDPTRPLDTRLAEVLGDNPPEPLVQGPKATALRDRVWDALYAIEVAPRGRGAAREQVIGVLRALALLRAVVAGEAVDTDALAAALPLLSRDFVHALRGARDRARQERRPTAPKVVEPEGQPDPVEALRDARAAFDALAERLGDHTRDGLDPDRTPWTATAADFDALDDKQRAVLKAAGVRVGHSITTVQARRRSVLNRLSAQQRKGSSKPTPSASEEGTVEWERPQPIGFGDLIRVEQELIAYEAGEVAHIENVLQGERKERVHRTSSETEETLTWSSAESEEQENELETADRYELQRESQETIRADQAQSTGVTVTAKYGAVELKGTASFALNRDTEASNQSATTYAQDVTRRSLERIQQTVSEERAQRTLTQVEETNTHTLDNSDGEGHVRGVYRWVDKRCSVQLVNYGQRLFYDLTIPEPAAFFVFARSASLAAALTVEAPEALAEGLLGAITEDTYLTFVEDYQLREVPAPPPPSCIAHAAFSWSVEVDDPSDAAEQIAIGTGWSDHVVEIPEGYTAKTLYGQRSMQQQEGDFSLTARVGDGMVKWEENGDTQTHDNMGGETGSVPATLYSRGVKAFTLNLRILCERTDAALDAWKQQVFTAILEAREARQAEYDEAVRQAAAAVGVTIEGRPSALCREIEAEELKKHSIRMLSNEDFTGFGAVVADFDGYPEPDPARAAQQQTAIRFFEHAFEWDQMAWVFYPYFWGQKSGWLDRFDLRDADEGFTQFLRAGAARVLLPVRPGFEEAMLHFSDTGELWAGGELPGIDDDLYLSIIEELAEAAEAPEEGEPVGDPWELIVPTALVWLQDDATLPGADEDGSA